MPHRIRIDLEPEVLPQGLKGWEKFLTWLRENLPGNQDDIDLTAIDSDHAHQFSCGDPVQGLILIFYAEVPGAERLDDLDLELIDLEHEVGPLQRDVRAIENSLKALPAVPAETAAHLAKLKADLAVKEPAMRAHRAEVTRLYRMVEAAHLEWEQKVTVFLEYLE